MDEEFNKNSLKSVIYNIEATWWQYINLYSAALPVQIMQVIAGLK
jgi:hypothetical protein